LFALDFLLFLTYNNNVKNEIKYMWDEGKRKENIKKRGLDIAILALGETLWQER